MTESFTEVRCTACINLGWYSSHLLLRASGVIEAQEVQIEVKCPRCKSLVKWTYGTPKFDIISHGVKNHRPAKAVFE